MLRLVLLIVGLVSNAFSAVETGEQLSFNDAWINEQNHKGAMQRRNIADSSSSSSSSNITIPFAAHFAYCTAITGWYSDKCVDPNGEPEKDFCDAATYTELDEPVWIDLTSCFANPNLNGRSVSFFGEPTDEDRLLEFHLIFLTDKASQKYQGVNCKGNGKCECPQAVLDLKRQFLDKASCESTDEYDCIAEDFYGSTDACFVPASVLWGQPSSSDIWCSMMARTEQFGPCNRLIEIPESSKDSFCTGITGWYKTCLDPNDPVNNVTDMCVLDSFVRLSKPAFLDFSHCYSNPYLDQRSVSFYGATPDGEVKSFELIFTEETLGDYRPMNCTSDGVCTCSPAVQSLKQELTLKGSCDDSKPEFYSCFMQDFTGVTDRCYVPSSLSAPDGFQCSLVARVEEFHPCEKADERMDNLELTSAPSVASAESTSAPSVVSTESTSPQSAGIVEVGPAPSSVPAQPALVSTGDKTDIATQNSDAFYTAITGWWSDCTDRSGRNYCSGGFRTELEDDPIFIDLESCYSNPNFDGRSVSFYARDGEVLLGFHLLFKSPEMYDMYAPKSCDVGVCDCGSPPALADLKKSLIEQKECGAQTDINGISCVTQATQGLSEDCYVPMLEGVATDSGEVLYCAMVAQVRIIDPGSSPQSETSKISPSSSAQEQPKSVSHLAGSLIGGILVMVSFLIIVLVVGLAQRRLRHLRQIDDKNDAAEQDEIEWVKTNSHNPKYSTRAWTSDPTEADGVWKNIGVGLHTSTRNISDDFSIS